MVPVLLVDTQIPSPEHCVADEFDGHCLSGATQTPAVHLPYKQLAFVSHGCPTTPKDDAEVASTHPTFEAPTIPTKPGKQLPQVLATFKQPVRFRLAHEEGADEQSVVPM
jgi:hypothetical protein